MDYRSHNPPSKSNDFTIDVAPAGTPSGWSSRSPSPVKGMSERGSTDFGFETRDIEKNLKSYAPSIAESSANIIKAKNKDAGPRIPLGAKISEFIHEWTPFILVFSYFVFSTG
jgi:hypothetical protein